MVRVYECMHVLCMWMHAFVLVFMSCVWVYVLLVIFVYTFMNIWTAYVSMCDVSCLFRI
jgi:hypothetical protein